MKESRRCIEGWTTCLRIVGSISRTCWPANDVPLPAKKDNDKNLNPSWWSPALSIDKHHQSGNERCEECVASERQIETILKI